jgi:hypothetical protein
MNNALATPVNGFLCSFVDRRKVVVSEIPEVKGNLKKNNLQIVHWFEK